MTAESTSTLACNSPLVGHKLMEILNGCLDVLEHEHVMVEKLFHLPLLFHRVVVAKPANGTMEQLGVPKREVRHPSVSAEVKQA